jgi:hypothetical protein
VRPVNRTDHLGFSVLLRRDEQVGEHASFDAMAVKNVASAEQCFLFSGKPGFIRYFDATAD